MRGSSLTPVQARSNPDLRPPLIDADRPRADAVTVGRTSLPHEQFFLRRRQHQRLQRRQPDFHYRGCLRSYRSEGGSFNGILSCVTPRTAEPRVRLENVGAGTPVGAHVTKEDPYEESKSDEGRLRAQEAKVGYPNRECWGILVMGELLRRGFDAQLPTAIPKDTTYSWDVRSKRHCVRFK